MRFETFEKAGERITIPIPETFKDSLILCQSDRYRVSGSIVSRKKILCKSLLRPFTKQSLLVWFRLSCIKSKFWAVIFRKLYGISSKKYNIDIPCNTKIGYGFYMGHGICIVINGDTVIGNNVNISQFLNIGTNHDTPSLIADNVYIAPMCCIVEDVVIGKNSVIGAGAVVTKNVPANKTVAGVPAKVINDCPHNYINNPYQSSECN